MKRSLAGCEDSPDEADESLLADSLLADSLLADSHAGHQHLPPPGSSSEPSSDALSDASSDASSDETASCSKELASEGDDGVSIGEEEDEEKESGMAKEHLEPFNMAAEMAEGSFDKESGSYVAAVDRDRSQDCWMEAVSRSDILKAQRGQQERLARLQEAERPTAGRGDGDLIQRLVALMAVGDTVSETLQGMAIPARRFDAKSKRLAAARGAAAAADGPDVAARRARIEEVTEVASELLSRGLLSIYQMTREELQRRLGALHADR